ncbi:carboxypeptidase regulatory-like domain-containing protein [Candidatus Nomurabacteria bacterium]|nr:MAG: carboxypeptidase regulatory-like domain-containing protein [Candidatus Nomurabacteria bacterium]
MIWARGYKSFALMLIALTFGCFWLFQSADLLPITVFADEIIVEEDPVSVNAVVGSGDGGEDTGGGGGSVSYCQDAAATNFGDVLPCQYSPLPTTCVNPLATNYGGDLPCVFAVENLCQDPDAVNYQGVLPCFYAPPPPRCQDAAATNFGEFLPCTYPESLLCQDLFAENYGNPLPCSYQEDCTGPDCDVPSPCVGTGCTNDESTTPGGGGTGNTNPTGPSDFATAITNVGIITDQVTESLSNALTIIGNTIQNVTPVLVMPAGSVETKIITTGGLVGAGVFSLASLLFINPLSFSEIIFLPLRLWSLLLAALGLWKRRPPWGTVYDSITKQPLDPAYVVLYDKDGKEAATSITDLDGRYGFLPHVGTYTITVQKTNYEFPSKKLQGLTHDEIYQDLYFGSSLIIKEEGEVITKNIPMDPLNFDWNEFAKRQNKLMKFYSKRYVIWKQISDTLFVIGLVLALIAFLVAPKPYNTIILLCYLVFLFLRQTNLFRHPLGSVVEKSTNEPLAFAVVHIFHAGSTSEIMRKVADKSGRFYSLVPNGKYYVKIEKKNADMSYSLVHTSMPFIVRKGHIDTTFKI